MTGKDLAVVVLVAGVVGAGAAFAAGVVNPPPAPPDTSSDVAARLDRIETALARAAESQKDARESAAKLAERVTGIQMDVNTAREEMKAAAAAAPVAAGAPTDDPMKALIDGMRKGRVHRARADGPMSIELGGSGVQMLGPDGLKLEGLDAAAGGKVADEVRKRLGGLGAGLSLRMLPEKERWEKAKTDLGLQDYQVENLKQAVAERDTAMKDAMKVETSTDGDASTIRIRRPDREKLTSANRDYDRKVSETLDQDQKKKWDEKGYGVAFGSPSGGSIAVVSSMEIESSDGEEPGGK